MTVRESERSPEARGDGSARPPEPAHPPKKTEDDDEESSQSRDGPGRDARSQMDDHPRSERKFKGSDTKGEESGRRRRRRHRDREPERHRDSERREDRHQSRSHRSQMPPPSSSAQTWDKDGETVCNCCHRRVGGWEVGFQTHCTTSKYHRAAVYYNNGTGLPWPQALARASKEWQRDWDSSGVPSREDRRSHSKGSELTLREAKPPHKDHRSSVARPPVYQEYKPKGERASGSKATAAEKKPSDKKKKSKTAQPRDKKATTVKKEESPEEDSDDSSDGSSSSSDSGSGGGKKKPATKPAKPAGKDEKPKPPAAKDKTARVVQAEAEPKASGKNSSLESMALLFEAQALVMRSLNPE